MSHEIRGLFEKNPGSGVYWIQYFDARGRRRREKAGSKSAAMNLYVKRKAEALQGVKLPETMRSVVRIADLAPTILRDYRNQHRKSVAWVERRLNLHILPFFGSLAADKVGTDDFNNYIDKRKAEKAENASINRELAVLKRMYHLARSSTPPKAQFIPEIPRLKENAPRKGFVEDHQYNLLVSQIEERWLRALLAVGYTYGFREAELLSLQVSQVNLGDRTITLHPGETKNDEGRSVGMTTEVYYLLRQMLTGKNPADFVFTRADGTRVIDFRGTWWNLCERAGLGRWEKDEEDGNERWHGLLFHDLRRSAVRNLIRSGVPERVAMSISGHKTRSVFDRYNIVSQADMHNAARLIEKARQERGTTTTATEDKTKIQVEPAMADKLNYLQ